MLVPAVHLNIFNQKDLKFRIHSTQNFYTKLFLKKKPNIHFRTSGCALSAPLLNYTNKSFHPEIHILIWVEILILTPSPFKRIFFLFLKGKKKLLHSYIIYFFYILTGAIYIHPPHDSSPFSHHRGRTEGRSMFNSFSSSSPSRQGAFSYCSAGGKCQFFLYCWLSGGSLGASCGPLFSCCISGNEKKISAETYGPVKNDPCEYSLDTSYTFDVGVSFRRAGPVLQFCSYF